MGNEYLLEGMGGIEPTLRHVVQSLRADIQAGTYGAIVGIGPDAGIAAQLVARSMNRIQRLTGRQPVAEFALDRGHSGNPPDLDEIVDSISAGKRLLVVADSAHDEAISSLAASCAAAGVMFDIAAYDASRDTRPKAVSAGSPGAGAGIDALRASVAGSLRATGPTASSPATKKLSHIVGTLSAAGVLSAEAATTASSWMTASYPDSELEKGIYALIIDPAGANSALTSGTGTDSPDQVYRAVAYRSIARLNQGLLPLVHTPLFSTLGTMEASRFEYSIQYAGTFAFTPYTAELAWTLAFEAITRASFDWYTVYLGADGLVTSAGAAVYAALMSNVDPRAGAVLTSAQRQFLRGSQPARFTARAFSNLLSTLLYPPVPAGSVPDSSVRNAPDTVIPVDLKIPRLSARLAAYQGPVNPDGMDASQAAELNGILTRRSQHGFTLALPETYVDGIALAVFASLAPSWALPGNLRNARNLASALIDDGNRLIRELDTPAPARPGKAVPTRTVVPDSDRSFHLPSGTRVVGGTASQTRIRGFSELRAAATAGEGTDGARRFTRDAKEMVTRLTAAIRFTGTTIPAMIPPIRMLLMKMRGPIANDEIGVIVGDDASGRLPTLMVGKAVNAYRRSKGMKAVPVVFIEGTKKPHEKGQIETFSAIERHQLAGLDRSKRALVVTDRVGSGLNVASIIERLHDAGFVSDVASFGDISQGDLDQVARRGTWRPGTRTYAANGRVGLILDNTTTSGLTQRRPKFTPGIVNRDPGVRSQVADTRRDIASSVPDLIASLAVPNADEETAVSRCASPLSDLLAADSGYLQKSRYAAIISDGVATAFPARILREALSITASGTPRRSPPLWNGVRTGGWNTPNLAETIRNSVPSGGRILFVVPNIRDGNALHLLTDAARRADAPYDVISLAQPKKELDDYVSRGIVDPAARVYALSEKLAIPKDLDASGQCDEILQSVLESGGRRVRKAARTATGEGASRIISTTKAPVRRAAGRNDSQLAWN